MKTLSDFTEIQKHWTALLALDKLWGRTFDSFYPIYLVGGAVAGIYLGKYPNDYDIASNIPPARVLSAFKESEVIDVIPTGVDYGTVTLRFLFENQHYHFEHTTFREDLFYTPTGRSPTVKFGSSIEGDLERRDFTAGAMAFKLHDSTLVDPHGGLTHLEKGELHWVGNYNERITEDPLRIMRYYITKVKYRLKDMPGYSNDTFTPFKEAFLRKVSANRVYEHLYKIFDGFRAFEIEAILNEIQRDCPWILYDEAKLEEFYSFGGSYLFEPLPEEVILKEEDIPFMPDLHLMCYLDECLPYLRQDVVSVLPGRYYRDRARLDEVEKATRYDFRKLRDNEGFYKKAIPVRILANLSGRSDLLKDHRIQFENIQFGGHDAVRVFPFPEQAHLRSPWIRQVGIEQFDRPEEESLSDFRRRIEESSQSVKTENGF